MNNLHFINDCKGFAMNDNLEQKWHFVRCDFLFRSLLDMGTFIAMIKHQACQETNYLRLSVSSVILPL